jgi:hypothetical protein
MKSFCLIRKVWVLFALSLLLSFPQGVLAQTAPSPVNPSYSTQTKFGYVHIVNSLVVDGATTLTGAVTQSGTTTFTAAPVAPGYVLTGTSFNATLAATASLGQATTYTVPDPAAATANFVISTGNANGQVAKSKIFNVNVAGATGTLADGATYTYLIAPGRAGTVTKISLTAAQVPTSGTNTLTITNNSTTNTLLSTANFDPTTITAANVSQPLTLTATGTDRILTATGTISVVYVAGTQGGTKAIAPVVSVEFLPTDY